VTDENTLIAVDSLVANEFRVDIDGEQMTGVFRIGGLVTFSLNGEASSFILTKMVQRDGNNPFNKWLRETIGSAGGSNRPTRTVSIVAVDDGVETRQWTANGAYIADVRYSDFDTGSSEMVEEIVTIHYEKLVEGWPATSNLE